MSPNLVVNPKLAGDKQGNRNEFSDIESLSGRLPYLASQTVIKCDEIMD